MNFPLSVVLVLVASAQAYWLMGIEDFLTTERIDPIVNPGRVSGHVHSVLGGSNFRFDTHTEALRQSECTSIPIPEDKSNYWFPHLYFRWANGSFTNVNGGAVIYYLFNDKPGTTTAFPDDFRMLSGDPTLRTYDPNSYAQQAVTFLCLDFDGTSTRHNSLPSGKCPSGIRAQINFPSCWDGKNLDSPDHKSHVAFLSGGPDSGTCSDPKFPVTLPRIFIEVYWAGNDFEPVRSQAMNPSQPFVYSHGDPTGYGYHADFINGWDKGVLQNAVDKCHCNMYGDPTCCVDQGIFHMNKGQTCRITKSINEATTGTLPKLPGNNPVQPEGKRATMYSDPSTPELISPVFAYTGDHPTQTGTIVPGGSSPASSSGSTSGPSSSTVPQPVSSPLPASSNTLQPPSPSQSSSTSTAQSNASAHLPSTTTSYAHTIPATTTKRPFPTFSIPSISIPSIPIPTFSIPHFPSVNSGNATGNPNYGGSDSGSSSGPHVVNSPNQPGAGVPNSNGHHILGQAGAPAPIPTSSTVSPSASSGKGRCNKRSKRSKRGLFIEGIDILAAHDVNVDTTPVPPTADVDKLDRARRSHRRRFTNHFMN